MTTILNKVASYLTGLSATNIICSALGTTLRLATTLFLGQEPNKSSDTVTLIPYGGGPPDTSGNKYMSSIQVRVKTNSFKKGMDVQQAMINHLHMNELDGRGLVMSVNSVPINLPSVEGGEKSITISNFYIRHVKI